MPITMHRLTSVKVQTLKTPGLHADGGGLYLKVAEGGSKSWVYRFQFNGRPRYLGLGSVAALSLAKARVHAAQAREQVRAGTDPIDARKKQRADAQLAKARALTFKQCASALIASHEKGWKNAKHRQQWRNTLESYVYPVVSDLPVGDVTTEHVLRVLEPLWATKTETGSRVRGRIEAVIDWATARGARKGPNPAQWRGHLANLLPKSSKIARANHHAALPFAKVPDLIAKIQAQSGPAPRAIGGLKIIFAPNIAGTLFGGINYWSDVPFGRMPSNDTQPVGLTSQIQSEDLIEVLAGARLTVALGGSAN